MKIELDDNEIAALIVFPIALLGTFCNWTICFKSRSTIAFRNSFGRLTTAQSFGDASHSTLFLTVFVPMAFFNIESLKHNSRHLGHVLLIAYDISTYLHLCISINRFYSIVFPLIYEKVFTRNFTLFLISISYSLAIFPSFYLYVYNNCQFYIDDYYWGFVFLNNTVCQRISWYADYIKYNVVIATIVTLDSVTVTKMHWNNEKISNKSSTSYALRRRREINFLKQACFQALVALWELINYFVITPRLSLSHKWLRFLSSTVSWVMVHVVDGVITITCNKEFHKIFKKRPVAQTTVICSSWYPGTIGPSINGVGVGNP